GEMPPMHPLRGEHEVVERRRVDGGNLLERPVVAGGGADAYAGQQHFLRKRGHRVLEWAGGMRRRFAVSKRGLRLSTVHVLRKLRLLANALLPERCAGCGAAGDAGLCAVCVAALPRVARPCARCGLATPVASCPRRAHAWTVASVVAPFAYAAPLDG